MNRPLKEVLADTVAHQNFVSQTLRLEEGQPIALEEGAANYRKELAQAIGEHHAAKYIASRVKFGDAKYRSRGMNEAQSLTGTELCNRIAFAEEGVNLPTEIANLDNTRINFLSVVLKGLLSDDAFMRMFRLIDAQEITGAGAMIWTESDIKQYSTALGVIAPLGWQGALVKDKPRYMVRQVLANKPIIFRRSTDSKLPYDKMSFDMSEYQRVMQGNVHSWLLDQICRAVLTAGQTNPRLLFATSGDVVNTGTPNPMFPNHLPTSARDIMSVTRSDIGAVKSRIRLQNFEGNPNIVMQESIAQTMYNDIDVRTQMSFRGTPTDEWLDQFLGVNLYKRDKVTAIETSGTTPAWAEVGLGYGYITNPDTGAVTALNPTITATMIDGFLAAGEGAAVMGIGAINVWETMMPENYGIEFSMDISLGCAPAYEGCEGLLVGVPSMGITA